MARSDLQRSKNNYGEHPCARARADGMSPASSTSAHDRGDPVRSGLGRGVCLRQPVCLSPTPAGQSLPVEIQQASKSLAEGVKALIGHIAERFPQATIALPELQAAQAAGAFVFAAVECGGDDLLCGVAGAWMERVW